MLGSWSFCGIDLLVDRRVLIPRPETEVVAQVAIGEVGRLGERVGRPDPWAGALTSYAVADLGTGSGALALALAFALPDAEVWATDVDDDALTVARANVAGSGTPSARVRIAEGSWFDALPAGAARPPAARRRQSAVPRGPRARRVSHASVADWEPVGALVSGPTGLEAFEAILADAPEWLGPDGTLVLELAPAPGRAGRRAGRRGRVRRSVEVHRDLAGRDRVLVARRAEPDR